MSAENTEALKCPIEHLRSPDQFNPFTPQFHQNPHAAFLAARQEQPVFFSPVMNLWVVTRYDDLKTVMKDDRTFASGGAFSSGALASPEALRVLGGLDHPIFQYSLVNADPPIHARFRSNFQRAFTARQVAILEPQIRELIHQLLIDLRTNQRVEVIKTFCDPLPLLTICRLMGLPDEDAPDIKRWGIDYIRAQMPGWSIEEQQLIGQSIADYYDYMLKQVKYYATHPAENLISGLIEARQNNDEPLSDEEIAGLTCNLVFAGHETTAALLGNTLYSLLNQRELWNYFCKHVDRITTAVDEFIRHGGPAVGLYRRTTHDVVLGEVTIPKDSMVWIAYLAGNHDPEQFPKPERLDCDRQNAAGNLSFGHGIHYCVGAPLAKLELRVVIEELTQHYPSLRLEPGQMITPTPNFMLRSYQEMILAID
ncbi:cytochrome P450 [Leptolyngbya sp. NIES-2104]|uniref:cytochrome P450 n=1 Tax=Leptolyngbya sp. NIES-2104 TaxID=1552121 RepID=UPI0006EC7BA7|nr:cytochrome P450 [Leptolyngbya sp. NIES-2104]GAQ00009.1 putative cytochrome P450 hydroxylase [Leptolyngbya sp. NIES-2104]